MKAQTRLSFYPRSVVTGELLSAVPAKRLAVAIRDLKKITPRPTVRGSIATLQVRDDANVVQKGKEKWEVARTPSTKVTGDLAVGAKATVEYTMTATTVAVKDGKAAAKPAKH